MMDLDRPANVRKIFDAISGQDVLMSVVDIYGPEQGAEVLWILTQDEALNGVRMTMWERASAIYDAVGLP